MKTIITKRNYLPLILFILSMVCCWYSLTVSTNEWKINFDKYYATENNDLLEVAASINLAYAVNLIIFSVILLCYIIISAPKESKILFSVLFVVVAWAVITDFKFDQIDILSVGDFQNNLKYMVFLFSPYIYFIIRDTFIGKKVDITETIKDNKRQESKKSIEELMKLKQQEIISENQFSQKANQILKEQIKTEFFVTEEYKTLLNLKNKGMFTKQEFDEKIEEIVQKRMNL